MTDALKQFYDNFLLLSTLHCWSCLCLLFDINGGGGEGCSIGPPLGKFSEKYKLMVKTQNGCTPPWHFYNLRNHQPIIFGKKILLAPPGFSTRVHLCFLHLFLKKEMSECFEEKRKSKKMSLCRRRNWIGNPYLNKETRHRWCRIELYFCVIPKFTHFVYSYYGYIVFLLSLQINWSWYLDK